MTTWSSFNTTTGTGTGARVTTWNYSPYRGWLDNKRYPNANDGTPSTTGPDYTYTAGGRLKKRTWARNGTDSQRLFTTYTYGFEDTAPDKEHGDLVKVEYSSNDPAATPLVSYGFSSTQAISGGPRESYWESYCFVKCTCEERVPAARLEPKPKGTSA